MSDRRAETLIVCPRCGLGNRLRAMTSAIHRSRELDVRLTHLWRRDSPVRSAHMTEDERLGANEADFEMLFEPIRFLEPFVDEGQTIRLLTEHDGICVNDGLTIVDELWHRAEPITEDHLAGVDAVLLLTSLDGGLPDATKIEIYQKWFRPRKAFVELVESEEALPESRLAVHLRTGHLTAYGQDEWTQEDVARATNAVVERTGLHHVVVFSDNDEAREEFSSHRFDGATVHAPRWETEDYLLKTFLDFLAISRSSFVVNSGLSSFAEEAALFGGGIPSFDVFRDRSDG